MHEAGGRDLKGTGEYPAGFGYEAGLATGFAKEQLGPAASARQLHLQVARLLYKQQAAAGTCPTIETDEGLEFKDASECEDSEDSGLEDVLG